MSTTTEAAAVPVLGEIVSGSRDGSRCVMWTLGTRASMRGLTAAGIAAAARASAEFLDSLGGRAAGRVELHITPVEWSLPLVPGRAGDVKALMLAVVNAEGSIGATA